GRAGRGRNGTAPTAMPVSVGTDGLVEISSFGSTDVRGRLYDAAGRLVASNDDRPGDWNFLLAGRLAAGTYRLAVDPVGASQAATTGSMNVPNEVEEKPLALPAALPASPGNSVHLYSLQGGADARLLGASAQSAENVGLSLEVEDSGSWRVLGSRVGRSVRLEAPINPGARHRLRLWSADRRGVSARLSAFAVAPQPANESQLARGIALSATGGSDTGLAAVRLDRPGLVRIESDHKNLRACSIPGGLGEPAGEATTPALTETLWLVKALAASSESLGARGTARSPASSTVRASRVMLPAGADRGVVVAAASDTPVVFDLAGDGAGPVLVTARSVAGQPGISLRTGGSPPDARRMALRLRSPAAP